MPTPVITWSRSPARPASCALRSRTARPFDVLLAADQSAPAKLQLDGWGVPGGRFTYAIGKLVLWSARPDYVDPAGAILKRGGFQHLAIANPKLAPYGAAAIEVLTKLGLLEVLRPRLVEGEDIGQARTFIATGNAELGFIAASQLPLPPGSTKAPGADGSYWMVPSALYAPLRQDALWLRRAKDNPAAQAFMAYLRGDRARAIIRTFGYTIDGKP